MATYVKFETEIEGGKIVVNEKGIMTITVDLNNEGHPSGSGKSMVLGTTSGNMQIPGSRGVSVGLNVYRKK